MTASVRRGVLPGPMDVSGQVSLTTVARAMLADAAHLHELASAVTRREDPDTASFS